LALLLRESEAPGPDARLYGLLLVVKCATARVPGKKPVRAYIRPVQWKAVRLRAIMDSRDIRGQSAIGGVRDAQRGPRPLL